MWVRVDDHVPHHPKFTKAGAVASWLWVCGNCHCNKYLTDGFIEEAALRTLGRIPNVRVQAARLILVGLWERVEGGYRVHDYHDHNPRADQIKAKREQDRLRKRLQSEDISTTPPRVPIVEKKPIPLPETFQTESDWNPERSRARDPIPVPSPPIPSVRKTLSVSDDVADKAGQFLERYPEIYAEERRGAHFQLKPVLHFQTACELVQGWPDLKRLELMFRTFCQLPTSEKMAWPGTPAQFLHLAPEIDVRLRQAGV